MSGAGPSGTEPGTAGPRGAPASGPTDRILVFEMAIPIRWGDMDAMGHVNNTVYFRYYESLRIAWFESLGFRPDPTGQGPIIVNARSSFVRELVYPGTVLARQYVNGTGRSSVETTAELCRTDDPGTVYAEGGATVVWVDFPKKKSAPLPDSARAAMLRPWVPAG